VFGPEVTGAPPARLNTHVDLIDWHGNHGGRDLAALVAEPVARPKVAQETDAYAARAQDAQAHVGFRAHRLDHDPVAGVFTEGLFALTAAHPGYNGHSLSDLPTATDQSRVA